MRKETPKVGCPLPEHALRIASSFEEDLRHSLPRARSKAATGRALDLLVGLLPLRRRAVVVRELVTGREGEVLLFFDRPFRRRRGGRVIRRRSGRGGSLANGGGRLGSGRRLGRSGRGSFAGHRGRRRRDIGKSEDVLLVVDRDGDNGRHSLVGVLCGRSGRNKESCSA